jgi:uncharacterized protein (TIGR00369 family)
MLYSWLSPVSHKKLTARQINEFMTTRLRFNRLLGMRVTRVHKDGVTVECAMREDLQNAAQALHGGVFATLADAAMGISLHRHLGGSRAITTVELKINYFRPVTEGRVFARARLVRIGSQICVGAVELTDDRKRQVGAALVTYMLLGEPGRADFNPRGASARPAGRKS